jgi:hypothetical protein
VSRLIGEAFGSLDHQKIIANSVHIIVRLSSSLLQTLRLAMGLTRLSMSECEAQLPFLTDEMSGYHGQTLAGFQTIEQFLAVRHGVLLPGPTESETMALLNHLLARKQQYHSSGNSGESRVEYRFVSHRSCRNDRFDDKKHHCLEQFNVACLCL